MTIKFKTYHIIIFKDLMSSRYGVFWPINNNIELLQKKKKRKKNRFLSYCSKLHGTGLKPGTFEFVTYLT